MAAHERACVPATRPDRSVRRGGAGAARLLPLLGAMLWTFLLVLAWQEAGPRSIGVALYAAAVLASAVVYLWPGAMRRLIGGVVGGGWDEDG